MTQRTPKTLYELEVITDDPRFEGFGIDIPPPSMLGRDSFDDDITPGFEASESVREWKPVNLAKMWKPPRVNGRVTSFNDFPGVDMVFPAFSLRACNVLRDLLEPNGELLPLECKCGEYFFYNTTRLTDVLDAANSQCGFWCDPPTTAVHIDRFEFKADKLMGLSIFRIFELPMATIVSDSFVDRVREFGLNGFHFSQIWPTPIEQNENYSQKIQACKNTNDIKQNTLVIILQLEHSKPNPHEKRKIKAIEDELDAQLLVPALNAPYHGSYEGNDTVDGEYRMFLSCPNVDGLFDKLETWLKNIDWPEHVKVVKRYGEINDDAADEQFVAVGQ